MRVDDWLKSAAASLGKEGIASARLDSLVLLEDLTAKDRAWLLAHPEFKLHTAQVSKLNRQIGRRVAHEPLAYIRGFTEFFGRRFRVNKRVLEPRPESETMIELLKKFCPAAAVMADVGTGSGAIGITAELELPGASVDLYDIDSSALAVARHNALMHELTPGIYKRDLLNRPVRGYDLILANLPYLPSHWRADRSITSEPRIAFFGGNDGLDLYRRLFDQLKRSRHGPRFILTESFPSQHEELTRIAADSGYAQTAADDFIQLFSRPV